jgi:hypothetical protein
MSISAALVETRAPEHVSAPAHVSPNGPVRLDRSLVDRACLGEEEALHTIVQQFIGTEERIEICEYLGQLGIPPFGLKSFAVVTTKRVGSLRIGWLGYVEYQDAPLEYTVSGLIATGWRCTSGWRSTPRSSVCRPDVLGRRPWSWLGMLTGAGRALALAWLISTRLYYAFRKCGVLSAVREGLWVYAFTNRGRMNVANRLHRRIFELREQRVRELAPVP